MALSTQANPCGLEPDKTLIVSGDGHGYVDNKARSESSSAARSFEGVCAKRQMS